MNVDEVKNRIEKYYEMGFSRRKILKIDNELSEFLNNFDELPTEMNNQLKIRLIHANIYGWGVCEECGGKTKASLRGISRFCSRKCILKHNAKDPTVHLKIEKTNLERYGTKRYTESKEGREKLSKIKQGFSDEKKKDIRKAYENTCLERYGVTNTFQMEGVTRDMSNVAEKLKATNLERYGVECYTQSDLYKQQIKKNYEVKYSDTILNQEWLDGVTVNFINSEEMLDYLDICYTTYKNVLGKHKEFNRPFFRDSTHERIIEKILIELGVKYIKNDRSVIKPKEIDFFLPEHNIGIEVNGIYWHSEKYRDRQHHSSKTEICKKLGIQLLQFWSHEIERSSNIIKSMIASKVNKSEKIFARNTEIRIVNSLDTKKFLNDNHLQGYKKQSSIVNIGLYVGEDLISLMTFGKSRFSKSHQYELIRYATLNGKTVVGGASKIFKYFKDNYMTINDNIISYCDLRYSNGNVYKKLGFNLLRVNPPGYGYCDNNGVYYNRQKFQKHKLKDILRNYDPNKTEVENMKENLYYRVWDCGQHVYHFPSLL